ncbi:MAG: transcriptional repressor NrdR [Phycisphaerales bacterium]|jgi:transcriptional repressor NrdR|nr:transcriptional repressor NrdR [Phycisphaerales bacterium]MBT7171717.1 transcriptional repressor NrdR [Phycisphaerales bacterium]
MQCPFCTRDNDKVIDSRSSEGGKVVRRRRLCLNCSRRFTTYERVEESIRLNVVKKDGTRVPYERDKMFKALNMACFKRPVHPNQLQAIVEAVEEYVFRRFDKEVQSSIIGDELCDRLREVDKIAYVRFASVYREFQDVGELIDEAEEVKDDPVVVPDQGMLFREERGNDNSNN